MLQNPLSTDEYGEVINTSRTYTGIADILNKHGSIVIGWTDERMSHFDVWMSVQAIQVGSLQRGLRAREDLFVAVMSRGAFGFKIERQRPLSAGYVAEKLQFNEGPTTERLAELINGVIEELAK